MLLGAFAALSVIVGVAVCAAKGAFAGSVWLWMLPVTAVGCLLGLVLLALALVLILVPMSLSRLLVRIVGGLIILVGLANLVLRSKFFLSLPQKKIVDAREDN